MPTSIYRHRHHVVPKHAGGTNDPNNLTCLLTTEEHAEHHHYRYEMLGEWQDRIAWRGLAGITSSSESRMEASRLSRIGKKGRACSEETKKQISLKLVGKKRSQEIRNQMSIDRRRRGRTMSKSASDDLSARTIGNKLFLGKKHSDATKEKLSDSLRGKKRAYFPRPSMIGNTRWVGRKHTPEAIERIRQSRKKRTLINKSKPETGAI